MLVGNNRDTRSLDRVQSFRPVLENFRVNFIKITRVLFQDRFGWGTKTRIVLKKCLSFSEFTFVGELLLPLWLVIKGVDVENGGTLAHSNRHHEYTS